MQRRVQRVGSEVRPGLIAEVDEGFQRAAVAVAGRLVQPETGVVREFSTASDVACG
ncbi:hypothetical protein [Amycolatopsis keratiniphila]|uniref:hypothetical protein n=1 Tax=Amycolatopsis keratiniphila TaxID=129921 RepID=UPI0012F94A79|nr:hypothetical protein [Amycolatopsis keratiniphila]